LDSLPEKELTLRDLLAIFRRRRKVVLGTLLACAVLAAFYCVICTRRYEATGTMQIQKEGADAMGLDSLMSGAEGASDALGANINLQTQANILQSDTLALKTIEDLHLEDTKDFQHHWNPISTALGLFSPGGVADAPNAKLEDAPQRRARALKTFSKNLKVKPVGGTRLIEISYQNPDPKLAAEVVNKLTQSLIDYTFRTRYEATNEATKWLGGQLDDLRQESENLQSKVVDLQKQVGVYSLGTTDATGKEQAYSDVLDQLQQANTAMSAAAQNRILKGAVAHAAETGDAEMLSGLAGNSITGQSQSVSNSLALIQNLRQQEATQQATLQEMESKFGPDYPKLAEVRGNIAGIDRSIRQEVNRIKGRAESDYKVAQQTEVGVKQQYSQAKSKAGTLNDKAVEYAIVRQEADESRGLYEDLLKRMKSAGVLEGLRPSNITVVDPGRTPAKPKKPNIPLYMAIALGGGFFFGCCGALLVDTLDNKINSVTDVEDVTGQNTLGALPEFPYKAIEGISVMLETHSTYAEAMRSIRTSLRLVHSTIPPKVILVTSSIAGEGKSTTSINLAAVLAETGRRVLLVDADLRRGSICSRLGLDKHSGLSALLSGLKKDVTVHSVAELDRLDVIGAGIVPPNPAELLDSEIMQQYLAQWREQYDYVIIDGSPLLPVTDSLTLNPYVDVTILLVRNRMTEKPQLKRSYQMLTENNKHYVGVLLNGINVKDAGYSGYYGYSSYSSVYGGNHDA
jgi:capsular exopolysaccharide synthesis family protein